MGDAVTSVDRSLGPDPRPRTETRDGSVVVSGWRCEDCGLPLAVRAPSCPECRGALAAADFGPGGTVWSSTVVHLDLAGIDAPYGLAYVDLDEGPRILAHTTETTAPVEVGTRVLITGSTARGDVRVAPAGQEVRT